MDRAHRSLARIRFCARALRHGWWQLHGERVQREFTIICVIQSFIRTRSVFQIRIDGRYELPVSVDARFPVVDKSLEVGSAGRTFDLRALLTEHVAADARGRGLQLAGDFATCASAIVMNSPNI